MVARYAFLAVVGLGSLAAAASMVPGDLERLAMLERDGRHEQAMSELQRLYDAGGRNPRLMLTLYNLKLRFGLVDDARTVLEEYARSRPSDTEAQLGLVRFYQTNQLEAPYVASLRMLQERTRSHELLTELTSYYRMTGRFREEEEVLERAARVNRATPADYERLGLLSAARGDLQRAARALRRADGRLDEQSRAARVGLFRVLIALKDVEEAHRRSLAWLGSWASSDLTVDFMDALSSAGRVDLALDLGNRFGGPGNDASLVTAELLHEQGKNAEALRRLREYESGGLPEDADRIQRFVSVASAVDGVHTAVKAARGLGLKKLDGAVIVDLLDALHDAYENARSTFPADIVRGLAGEVEARQQNVNPIGQEATDRLTLPDDLRLFVVRLALDDRDVDLGRRLLGGIDPDRLVSADLAIWSELQAATGLRNTAFPNIPRAWRQRGPADVVARRLPRSDSGAPGAPGAASSPTATRSAEGGAPPTSQSAGAREQRTVANAPVDPTSARARRNRRRLVAIERRRERARAATIRREQQLQGSPQLLPLPKPSNPGGNPGFTNGG